MKYGIIMATSYSCVHGFPEIGVHGQPSFLNLQIWDLPLVCVCVHVWNLRCCLYLIAFCFIEVIFQRCLCVCQMLTSVSCRA